ncbi:hypothetical protein ACJX0J_026783 [Zea mays]
MYEDKSLRLGFYIHEFIIRKTLYQLAHAQLLLKEFFIYDEYHRLNLLYDRILEPETCEIHNDMLTDMFLHLIISRLDFIFLDMFLKVANDDDIIIYKYI